jgi:aldehyde dehydrogenase (NAD+)|tara:strand:- start:9550 stop:11100 length:1551 start_codon:yes stop_codon:yes gene_type:complete
VDDSIAASLKSLGIESPDDGVFGGLITGDRYLAGESDPLSVVTPIDGSQLAGFKMASIQQAAQAIDAASDSYASWCSVPAPERGELVRRIGMIAREHKQQLANFITLEVGKTRQEALGEVQEWIDVCVFAVGLSRQLHGLTVVSERSEHRLMEQWLPLGPVGIITAFNFPMAVWAWNAMLALICGDTLVWKPSDKTPLCALACHSIVQLAAEQLSISPQISNVVIGDANVGEAICRDGRIPLVSATGSIPMGKKVAQTVAARLGRTVLELGGNNGMIISPTADLDLALRAIVFAAVGTTGQRCTSLRRLIVHKSIIARLSAAIADSYRGLTIGDPRRDGTVIGPLISEHSFTEMRTALDIARRDGGELLCGGDRVISNVPAGGVYVEPALVKMSSQTDIVKQETFAPILYVMAYESFEEAVQIHNGVPQGLSSAIFTENMREAERFLSVNGSDCGIANVNIGTSGAEIGGAFGGEKETGGGRESGTDSWRNYMRRATNTINYGDELPLAQGIEFDI